MDVHPTKNAINRYWSIPTCFCWPVEVWEQFTGLQRFEVSSPTRLRITVSQKSGAQTRSERSDWMDLYCKRWKRSCLNKAGIPTMLVFYRENHDWPMDFRILTLTQDKTHHKAVSPLSSHKKLALRSQKNLIKTAQNPWFNKPLGCLIGRVPFKY